MPTTTKALARAAFATSSATLYTVPSSTTSVISTIAVSNQAASAATFRIAVRPNAETLAAKHYIAYDSTVAANDTTAFTIGITLDAADVITVYASTATVSFNAFGSEIS